LLVVMAMGAAILRSLAVQHRLGRDEQRHLQAVWLADSAVARVAARLQADSSYIGETWQAQLDTTSRGTTGKVLIEISKLENEPDSRRVRIEAVWPDDPLYRSVQLREFVIHLNGEGETS
jgi:hypothetical protein